MLSSDIVCAGASTIVPGWSIYTICFNGHHVTINKYQDIHLAAIHVLHSSQQPKDDTSWTSVITQCLVPPCYMLAQECPFSLPTCFYACMAAGSAFLLLLPNIRYLFAADELTVVSSSCCSYLIICLLDEYIHSHMLLLCTVAKEVEAYLREARWIIEWLLVFSCSRFRSWVSASNL